MMRTLVRRGPDGEGLLEFKTANDGCCALGHRRLAILDLSDRGAQPMTSQDGRWSLVFNGEVFNYRELRAELSGVAWKSNTDTEVLLEAIARWGLDRTLRKLIGMFAFALWDHRERALLLARDRVGEKPLVYFHDGTVLAFASELKALDPLHDSRLDAAAVELYLALGYVPAPLAIFRKTHKLPAGHSLCFKDGKITVERWWFPEYVAGAFATRRTDRIQELRELVGDAVALRLRSDVPIALALSGGIDSSVIACELARQGARPDAFTVVFDQDESDLPFARTIAAKYNLRHEVLHAEGSTAAALLDQIHTTWEQYDEPFADSSDVASLTLAQALSGRYKVILNGDGGDEAFGGYRHYEFIAAKQVVKAMAAAVGLRDGHATSTVYEQSKTTFNARERTRFLPGRVHDSGSQSINAVDRLLASDEFLRTRRPGALKRALWSDRHLYLANDLTHKMDMALSAHGIEGRSPFLDHRLLEWSQGLEDHELVRGREKKVLFREAYRDELPVEISARPKHGFGAPIATWLAGPLQQQLHRLLPSPLLDAAVQREVLAANPGQRVWTLFMFAGWAEQWGARW
jgi:asparagine synthase (glutamine-hydrolysing)